MQNAPLYQAKDATKPFPPPNLCLLGKMGLLWRCYFPQNTCIVSIFMSLGKYADSGSLALVSF